MICISLADIIYKDLELKLANFEMIEVRIDLLNFSNKELNNIFSMPISCIATCRSGKFSDKERLELLKSAILSGANFIDVELDSPKSYIKELSLFAKQNNCKVIISYHNFEKTPSKLELQEIIDFARKYNPAYIKIVTQAQTKQDVSRILSLYETNNNLIAFCMGEIGKISRIASLYLGADFTFASLEKGNETASGQLNYETINKIISQI